VDSFESISLKLLEEHPESLELHLIRQDQLLGSGELPELRTLYRQAVAEHPDSPMLGYLDARLAPPDESLVLTKELLERFPDHTRILARHGWALHQIGEFTRAQPFFDRALLRNAEWTLEVVAPAVRNLAALNRPEEALDLLRKLRLKTQETAHELVVLHAQLLHLTDGLDDPTSLRRMIRYCHGSVDDQLVLWYRLCSGAEATKDVDLGTIRDEGLRDAMEMARALEQGPHEALAVLRDDEDWDAGCLDTARLVALACAVQADGDLDTTTRLIQCMPLHWHVFDDSTVYGTSTPYTAALDWEVRAVLELCEGLRHPADSAERAEHFDRARSQDFMKGFAWRASQQW